MTDIEEHILEKLGKIAEEAEETEEDVILLFKTLRKAMEKMPQNIGISSTKLDSRTYNAIEEHYQSEKFKKAKEYVFLPFGVNGEAKDQNKELREEILKDFANLEKRDIMISGISGDGSDAKVMLMKVSDREIDGVNILFRDVYKPVKNRTSIKTTVINGTTVVIAGDLWTPGDTPIPRDYRKEIKYEGGESYENKRGFSKALDPNWRVSLIGIGMASGTKDAKVKDPDTGEAVVVKKPKTLKSDGRITKVTFGGDYADPNTPSFVLKKPLWFNVCKLKGFETRFSNELFISTRSKKGIEITPPKVAINIIRTIRNINKIINKKANRIGKYLISLDGKDVPKQKIKKATDIYELYKKFIALEYIPIIDLSDVDSYHMSHRAIRDKENNIVKSKEGWDNTDFNSFAITECSFSGVYEKEGKPPKMIITDASLPERESLFLKFSNGLKVDKMPSSTLLVCLTTSRGNQAYDVDTKKWIVDEENARAIAKIKGVKLLIDFTKLASTIDDIKKKIGNKKLKADL